MQMEQDVAKTDKKEMKVREAVYFFCRDDPVVAANKNSENRSMRS